MEVSFDYVDEVWVPSAFVRDRLKKLTAVPVSVVPHAIRGRRDDSLTATSLGCLGTLPVPDDV